MEMQVKHARPALLFSPAEPDVPETRSDFLDSASAMEDISERLGRLRRSRDRLSQATDRVRHSVISENSAYLRVDDIKAAICNQKDSTRGVARLVGALEEIFIARDDVSPLGLSEQDLFDKIKAMLGNLESEYLAYYQDAITKFTEYFDKIREALNKITSNATDSGEHVDFKNNGAKAALDSIVRAAWSVASFESKAEADKLGATLAPAFKVTQVGDKWEVHIDTSQASALRDQMPPDAKISNVAFNTWTNKRESSVASLNTAAQATAEAFSRANSTYDNLVKLLSSLIESMMKMMEGFLPT